jgi:hypothetical protein
MRGVGITWSAKLFGENATSSGENRQSVPTASLLSLYQAILPGVLNQLMPGVQP